MWVDRATGTNIVALITLSLCLQESLRSTCTAPVLTAQQLHQLATACWTIQSPKRYTVHWSELTSPTNSAQQNTAQHPAIKVSSTYRSVSSERRSRGRHGTTNGEHHRRNFRATISCWIWRLHWIHNYRWCLCWILAPERAFLPPSLLCRIFSDDDLYLLR